ncbi:amidase signature domain-containing protein [Melanogaster broomeanus]|nr:amidase signature domain-containing protein [Melanogaster broomeanus]
MPSWSQLAADKKQRQQKEIPQDWLITPPPETNLHITNTDVDVLLKKLASAEWSSVAVTTAFYKRAIIAQQLVNLNVNCLTEIFVERALARAAELDEALKKTGKGRRSPPWPPDIPQGSVMYKGFRNNDGLHLLDRKLRGKNAVLVDILEECGAVPFVRTNLPQTVMNTNPYNRSLTSGGSSGGEGALLALKGSPLGVGSDIGGYVLSI